MLMWCVYFWPTPTHPTSSNINRIRIEEGVPHHATPWPACHDLWVCCTVSCGMTGWKERGHCSFRGYWTSSIPKENEMPSQILMRASVGQDLVVQVIAHLRKVGRKEFPQSNHWDSARLTRRQWLQWLQWLRLRFAQLTPDSVQGIQDGTTQGWFRAASGDFWEERNSKHGWRMVNWVNFNGRHFWKGCHGSCPLQNCIHQGQILRIFANGSYHFQPMGCHCEMRCARINHGRFQRFQISGGMVVGVRDAPGGGGDAAVGALHSKDPAVTRWNSDGPSHISTQLHGAVLLSNGHAWTTRRSTAAALRVMGIDSRTKGLLERGGRCPGWTSSVQICSGSSCQKSSAFILFLPSLW